jgi:hypothetical protein
MVITQDTNLVLVYENSGTYDDGAIIQEGKNVERQLQSF